MRPQVSSLRIRMSPAPTANPGRPGGPETILGQEELQLPSRDDRAEAPQAAALPKLLVISAVSSHRPPYLDCPKKPGRLFEDHSRRSIGSIDRIRQMLAPLCR